MIFRPGLSRKWSRLASDSLRGTIDKSGYHLIAATEKRFSCATADGIISFSGIDDEESRPVILEDSIEYVEVFPSNLTINLIANRCCDAT